MLLGVIKKFRYNNSVLNFAATAPRSPQSITVRSLASIAAATLTLFFLATTPVAAAVPQPNGIGGTWELQFQDEFDGNSLDLSKWRPNWLGSSDTAITKPINGLEKSCYDPKQVSLTNGELHLTAEKRTCNSWQYASGLIQSNGKFNFTYGYAEARMWLPAGAGLWPAFWTDGQNWPKDGEIDVLEAYGDDEATYHYHYAGCGGDCGPGGGKVISGATSGWHTYAVYWEPGKITWYYDGKEVWKYTTGIVSSPHYLIANLGIDGNNAPLPATLRVDYIRVWKPLPGGVPGTVTPSPVPSTTPSVSPSSSPVACTQDAKLCPDGTYVGRTGPNCQFVCPSASPSASPTTSPTANPTASPSTCSNKPDITNDSKVNILDYSALAANFLKTKSGPNFLSSDLNCDGTVNLIDYTILSNSFTL